MTVSSRGSSNRSGIRCTTVVDTTKSKLSPRARHSPRRTPFRRASSPAVRQASPPRPRAAAPDLTVYKRPDMRHSRTVDFFWNRNGAVVTGSEVWGDASAVRAEEA